VSNKDPTVPNFPQVIYLSRIHSGYLCIYSLLPCSTYVYIVYPFLLQKVHLLWGEDDQIFNLELAQNMQG
jgi:hypothetical protein